MSARTVCHKFCNKLSSETECMYYVLLRPQGERNIKGRKDSKRTNIMYYTSHQGYNKHFNAPQLKSTKSRVTQPAFPDRSAPTRRGAAVI